MTLFFFPQRQNHEASLWLDRQQAMLLPVEHFMATFMLPCQLRSMAWHQQTLVYNLLFACVSSTLKDFGANPKNLGADMGMTAVLHTHNRRLDYHPHIHVIAPGGGVDKTRKQWKRLSPGQRLYLLGRLSGHPDITICRCRSDIDSITGGWIILMT